MTHRPDLREVLLKERISKKEADAALLQLLPGIQVFGGANWDSNDFLSLQLAGLGQRRAGM